MGMASLSKRITQKGGFRMRGRKLLAVLAGVSLLLGGIGVFTALATTLSGNQEADFNFLPPVVSTVGPTDPDVTAALTAFSTFERFVDFNASGNYTPGEPIYRQAVAGPVAVGNIRLTPFGGFAAGSVVAPGDPDIGLVTTAFPATDQYVDQNGSGNYTPGEPIYRDVDNSGTVSAGDLRLLGGPSATYVNPGDFAVLDTIIVTDGAGGSINAPLNVDRVCVAKTDPGSNKPVLRDSDILELRLYRENNAAAGFAGFGPSADDLLDIVPNPDLTVAEGQDLCANGVQFGDIGVLLFSVPGITQTASQTLYIVGTFSPAAQRGDHLQLIVKMVARSDLVGGGPSSGFIGGGESLTKTSPNVTIIGGPAVGNVFVIDETASLVGSAAPGSTIVLQQFSIENRENVLVTIERITAFAEGFRNGQLNNSVLAGITRVRLFRESGSTGPGWQEGDELLGTVTRPDLVNGARFGGNRRTLITIQPRSVQRFYIVADLSVGMNDGDVIQGAVEVSASSGRMIAPPKITPALGSWEIEAPAATITVGDVTLSSRGKVKVSVANVPSPGLDSIQGVISFDPEIIQVVSTAQGTYRVRGLGNYLVDDLTVNNEEGTIEFLLTLKPGRRPLTGNGDIMEIEFESAQDVNPGDSSPLDIEIDAAADVNGDELIFNEVSGTARIKLIMGDVDGNGVVTRRDATLLARWLMGRAVLTPIQKKAADVDHSCPATTNWEALAPGGCVDETDVRWIKEAAAGLRTLRSSANFQVLGRGLTVLMLPSGGLELRAPSAERLSLQVFGLSGQMVFSAESATGTLRFAGVSNRGQRLAKGVYLYVVTLYGRDGSVWRSEVRKLIIR
jgi:hypothetical protein